MAGDVEGPLRYNKTDKGIEVIITSLSPFAIHWSKNISDSQESQEGEEDKDTAKPSDSGNNDNKKETAKEYPDRRSCICVFIHFYHVGFSCHSVGLLHIW